MGITWESHRNYIGGRRIKFKDINLLSLAMAISIWDEDVETIVEKLKASLKKEE